MPAIAGRFCLTARIGERTWLARAGDGLVVVATRLGAAPSAIGANLADVIDRASALASLQRASLVPVRGAVRHADAIWMVSECADGVSLRRLLQVASLTAGQAVFIAVGVLSALRSLHAAGYAHTRLSSAHVHVGVDARVRLGGWAPANLTGTESFGELRQADVAALAGLLGELAHAARRPAPPAGSQAAGFLAALNAAADRATPPGADAERVAAEVEGAAELLVLAEASSELTALVAAVLGSGLAYGQPPPTPCPPRPPAPCQTPRGRGAAAGPKEVLRALVRRLWRLLAVLAVFATAVTFEFVFLHGQIAHDIHLLRGSGQSGTAPLRPSGEPAGARRAPAGVALPAPLAAGAVTGVGVRPLRPCTAGAVCQVRVLVRMSRQAKPVPVHWSLEVVNRCIGAKFTRPAGAVVAGPGSTHVYAVSAVLLPPGRALAVIAVTSQPARAAGWPLLVAAGGRVC